MEDRKIVIEAKSLIKKYDDKTVVKGIELEVLKGECFGVLGPNGAGKTTTMKMMYCSSPTSSGDLYVLGLNVRTHLRDIKSRIGVVPQDDGLDPDFSVLDNLLIYCRYHGIYGQEAMARSLDLLRFVRLDDVLEKPIETLSGGMKRRLVVARALLNSPELIFLDEPTTGLDPQARVWIWDALRDLKKDGVSLILTTHYMEEAENLCDRVAIMDDGKVLVTGKPDDLIAEYVGREVVEFECKVEDRTYYLNRLRSENYEYRVLNQRVCVYVRPDQDSRKALSLIASENIVVRKAGLNDVFLKLAGHQLRD
ncbi:MAG: ABC transporter ATP-binding protein [Pseudobdellovibrionaceae bacterium]